MSFRPSISVYVDRHIVDWSCYRNWDVRSLYYEAIATLVLYRDCRTAGEYRQKRFGTQTVFYSLYPEKFENTESNLKMLESYSEFPIIVDLTERSIYLGEEAMTREEQLACPQAAIVSRKHRSEETFWRLIKHSVLMLTEEDLKALVPILREWCGERHPFSEDIAVRFKRMS